MLRFPAAHLTPPVLLPLRPQVNLASLARQGDSPCAPSPDVSRRLQELRDWAKVVGDETAGVEELLAHPALNCTVNEAIYMDVGSGTRYEEGKWAAHVEDVYRVHNQQTEGSRADLTSRWSSGTPLLGPNVNAWDLLKLLHFTIDNTDGHLRYTSQFIHCLQVYQMVKDSSDPRMELDEEYRDDMLVGALFHDMGKSLSLFGEADGNVDCMNRVTRYDAESRRGLDGLDFQYNHDRFGHDKLALNREHGRLNLPPRVFDIVKLHSLREMGCMDELVKTHNERRLSEKPKGYRYRRRCCPG